MRALALALGLTVALSACGSGPDLEGKARAETPAAAGDAEISLSAEAGKSLAIVAAEAAEAPAVVNAAGRVLDAATLVDAASALASAEVAAGAAARDASRTRALARDEGNASARELAAAELADAQARGALAAAQTRALASFGTSESARIARLAESLARGEIAIGRIELPPGVALPGSRDEIRVSAPTLGSGPRVARLLGSAGALEPSVQGRAVLVSIGPPAPPAGAALEATLALGAPVKGIWLAQSAVVWSDGNASVFVATSAATFARRAVTIARPLRDGYLVSSGVAAGERVVTSGAQQLLSSLSVSGELEED